MRKRHIPFGLLIAALTAGTLTPTQAGILDKMKEDLKEAGEKIDETLDQSGADRENEPERSAGEPNDRTSNNQERDQARTGTFVQFTGGPGVKFRAIRCSDAGVIEGRVGDAGVLASETGWFAPRAVRASAMFRDRVCPQAQIVQVRGTAPDGRTIVRGLVESGQFDPIDVTSEDARRISTADLRVRELPTTDAGVAGGLNEGQEVRVTGRVADTRDGYAWRRIRYGTGTAYVAAQFLKNPDTTQAADADTTQTDKTAESEGSASNSQTSTGQEKMASADAVDEPSSSEEANPSKSGTDRATEADTNKSTADKDASGNKVTYDLPKLSYETMLNVYMAEHTDIARTAKFQEHFQTRFLCDAYKHNREQRRKEFVEDPDLIDVEAKAASAVNERIETTGNRMQMILDVSIGEYDHDVGGFPILTDLRERRIPQTQRFELSMPKGCGYADTPSIDPAEPVWPRYFQMKLANTGAIDYLEMPVEKAQRFIQEEDAERWDFSLVLKVNVEAVDPAAEREQYDGWNYEDIVVSRAQTTALEARLVYDEYDQPPKVMKTWSGDTLAKGAKTAESTDDGPETVIPSKRRLTMLYHELKPGKPNTAKEIARGTEQAQEANEFDRRKVVKDIAEKLAAVEDIRARRRMSEYANRELTIGEYQFDKKQYPVKELAITEPVETTRFQTLDGETFVFDLDRDLQLDALPIGRKNAERLLKRDGRDLAIRRVIIEPTEHAGKVKRKTYKRKLTATGYEREKVTVQRNALAADLKRVEIVGSLANDKRAIWTWTPDKGLSDPRVEG